MFTSVIRRRLLGSKGSSTISILALSVSYWSTHFPVVFLLVSCATTDQWLLFMSTQLIGFAIGGICKRILVAPPSMIWPRNLVTAALLNALHAQETLGSRSHDGISRLRFFTYVFVGYYFYSQPLCLGCLDILITHCRRFLALLSLHCSLELLLDLLDCSQQCQG